MAKSALTSFILLLIFIESSAQNFNFNPSSKTDTLLLGNITLKKIVAYKINSVTILADYSDFMKSFTPFWKQFKKRVHSRGKASAKESPSYSRFIFLDSTYKRLTAQIKTSDTVYIFDSQFRGADIGTSYDFVESIKQGKCIVLDNNNIRQKFVLRQRYEYQKDWLSGWGGYLYYIPGQEKPFIRNTIWVS